MLRNTVLGFMSVIWLSALLIAPAGAEVTGDERFLSSLQDIPLMPGLTEIEEQSVFFDKPSGRIAESAAITENVEPEEINRFYSVTLPQMGWHKIKNGAFVRQDERLKITVAEAQGHNLVRFTLTPR